MQHPTRKNKAIKTASERRKKLFLKMDSEEQTKYILEAKERLLNPKGENKQ